MRRRRWIRRRKSGLVIPRDYFQAQWKHFVDILGVTNSVICRRRRQFIRVCVCDFFFFLPFFNSLLCPGNNTCWIKKQSLNNSNPNNPISFQLVLVQVAQVYSALQGQVHGKVLYQGFLDHDTGKNIESGIPLLKFSLSLSLIAKLAWCVCVCVCV